MYIHCGGREELAWQARKRFSTSWHAEAWLPVRSMQAVHSLYSASHTPSWSWLPPPLAAAVARASALRFDSSQSTHSGSSGGTDTMASVGNILPAPRAGRTIRVGTNNTRRVGAPAIAVPCVGLCRQRFNGLSSNTPCEVYVINEIQGA